MLLRTGHLLLLKGCRRGIRGYPGRRRQERSEIAMGGRRSLCELHVERSMEIICRVRDHGTYSRQWEVWMRG
jgi:hypothetical protein